jgi:hypothetical protein
MTDYIGDVTIEDEVANLQMERPHVFLLGAGASKAALPDGDKHGKPLPLMRDLAKDLSLTELFPEDLRALASNDFEAAYSELFERGDAIVAEIDERIARFFGWLRLPDSPTLYDYLLLCLREKDAIFTFNWDPLLVHARIRLAGLGVTRLPKLFFLHGNVAIGFCVRDQISGIPNRSGLIGQPCSQCGQTFAPSKLLFPVARKNYQDDPFTVREWKAARWYLENCFMFTIFGFSAPKTDVEAVGLLKDAWGDVEERQFEQTEVINRPGSDHDALRATWDPFIHTHHYDIFDSFFDSWSANHPRRTGEAYWSQYLEAQFITDNPVPREGSDLAGLVEWFRPLLEVEEAQGDTPSNLR